MGSLNKVYLMGHLTRDIEVRHTSGDRAIAKFGMAVNRKFKTAAGEQKNEVTFVDLEAWGKTAEVIAQYLKRGSPIFVEGRLTFQQWDDKNGGGKRSKLLVTVENFQFVGEGSDDPEYNGGNARGMPQPASKEPPKGAGNYSGGPNSDDIPF